MRLPLAIALIALPSTARASDTYQLVSLIVSAPTIGPGSRTELALYSNGRMVYLDRSAHRRGLGYLTVQLDDAERDRFMASLPSMDAFFALEPAYGTPSARNNALCAMRSFGGKSTQCVNVRGDLRGADRARAPAPYLALYDLLMAYADERAQPWYPKALRVKLTRAQPDRTQPTVTWPPTLRAAFRNGRQDEDDRYIVLTGEEVMTFLRLFGAGNRLRTVVERIHYSFDLPSTQPHLVREP
jgi:hypothetical protein